MTPTELSKLIPDEVVEAGADEVIDIAECEERCERIRRSYEGTPCKCREVARAAIAAGLAAWPMAEMPHVENAPAFIILPLTQEASDEATEQYISMPPAHWSETR